MVAKTKRGLGRNLHELLAASLSADDDVITEAPESTSQGTQVKQAAQRVVKVDDGAQVQMLPISDIVRSPYQPRRDFDPDALEELSNSIKAQGIIQPIVVRENEQQQYELIAGERRWRAAKMAGLDTVPALVRDLPDKATLAVALIENIQREDLNPMDEARSLKRLSDEFQLTHLEVAEAVGKSRASVSNLLRLLSLNEDVQQMLENGDIEMGHARALLALSGKLQSDVGRTIVMRGLSVRDTEALIRNYRKDKSSTSKEAVLDPNIIRLRDDLSEKIGAAVSIKCNAKGKGKLIISYNSLDELDGILAHIK